MPDKKDTRSTKVEAPGPKPVKLPPKPTFEKDHRLKEEEHKRKPKPRGRFRPVKDIGKPTEVPEARQ